MNDGVDPSQDAGGDVSVVRFTSYAFDLSAFRLPPTASRMLPKDRTIAYLLNPDPNDKIFQRQARSRSRPNSHRRFTEWIYSIVFALIALAVAGDARSHREARIHPLITAMTIALFVRWLGFFAASKAQTTVLAYAYVVYAVPIVAVAVAIWFIVTNRTMELPIALVGLADRPDARISERWSALQPRLPRRRARRGERHDGLDARPLFLLPLRRHHDLVLPRRVRAGLPHRLHRAFRADVRPAGLHLRVGLGVSALRVPMIMLQTVPFVALFSAMATLISLNRKYELVIARSAGISAWQFLLPCCIGALHVRRAGGRACSIRWRRTAFRGPSCWRPSSAPASPTRSRPFSAPWIQQKTNDGDTIIGARAVLNQGWNWPTPCSSSSIDQDGDIVERKDAARAFLRDGYWELQDVRRLARTATIRSRSDRPGADQSEARIRAGTAGAARNDPVLRPAGKIEVARSFGLRANAFAMQFHSLLALPVPAGRDDADCGNSVDAICADGAVGHA